MAQQILTNEKFLSIFEKVEELHGSKLNNKERKLFEEKFGKSIYHSISKKEFDKEKNKVLEKLPTLSKSELTYEIYRLFALYKDAHTRLYPLGKNEFMNIQLKKIGNQIVIVGIDEINKDLLLKPVEAINGISIKDLVKKARTMIAAETNQYANNVMFANNYFKRPVFLEALGLLNCRNGITVTVEGKDYKVSFNKPGFVKCNILKIPYKYGFERKGDIAFIGYYVSSEDEDYPIKDFCKDLNKSIEQGEPIIIDLRGNPGGSSSYFEKIANVLKKKEVEGYFLTDGGTFSAGTWAAGLCKKLGFLNVGEEWGEPTKRFGDCPNLTEIPELGLCFTVSERYFDLGQSYAMENLTNKPDVEVHNTLKDYKNGYDRVLQCAIDIINKNRNENERTLK